MKVAFAFSWCNHIFWIFREKTKLSDAAWCTICRWYFKIFIFYKYKHNHYFSCHFIIIIYLVSRLTHNSIKEKQFGAFLFCLHVVGMRGCIIGEIKIVLQYLCPTHCFHTRGVTVWMVVHILHLLWCCSSNWVVPEKLDCKMPYAFMQGIRIAHILSIYRTKAVVGVLFSIWIDTLKLIISGFFPHNH